MMILNDIEVITEHSNIIIIIIITVSTEILRHNSHIPQSVSIIACTSRRLANHRN